MSEQTTPQWSRYDDFPGWVTRVYEPAVKVIAEAFSETTGWDGDHFARACLARLVAHDPSITVEVLLDDEPAPEPVRGEVRPLDMYEAACDCGWTQKHSTRENAQVDLDEHLAHWHEGAQR